MKNLIFNSNQHYKQCLGDMEFWHKIVNALLMEHELIGGTCNIQAGYNPTYPVFLNDKYVVKLFGFMDMWQDAFNIESMAHETLLKDNTVLVPTILAKGQLFSSESENWPYIISTRAPGDSWLNTQLSHDDKKGIAAELGKLMDSFDWDKDLLKTLLKSSNWPVTDNFSKQALGLALYRQAVGLTQHTTFDVFYKLPDIIELESIATLGELALMLFEV